MLVDLLMYESLDLAYKRHYGVSMYNAWKCWLLRSWESESQGQPACIWTKKKDRHSVLVGWVLYMLRETLECSDGESLRVRRLGMGIDQQSQHMRVVDLANIWCVQKRWIQSTEYEERWNVSVSVWTQCGNPSAVCQGVSTQVFCVLGKRMY